MVKNGNIDIAVIYAPDNDQKLNGLKVYDLKKLHYCLIGNKEYAKYSKKVINFNEIKNENLILNTINPIQLSLLKDISNKTYNSHINLTSHSLVYEFVKEGFGVGVVIKEFIEDNLDNNDLFEIKLKEKFEHINLIMIINKSNFPSYATAQLIELIKEKKDV